MVLQILHIQSHFKDNSLNVYLYKHIKRNFHNLLHRTIGPSELTIPF